MDWALLIAYNRGKMDRIKGSTMYQKYQHMMEGYDLVTGHIANDRMFVVLDRFFRGEITDKALIASLLLPCSWENSTWQLRKEPAEI